MDIARWGLGIDTLANSVLSYGGRFGYEDAGDTPNTEVSILEFGPDKTLVFEVRGLKTRRFAGGESRRDFLRQRRLYGQPGIIRQHDSPLGVRPQGKAGQDIRQRGRPFATISATSCKPSAAARRRN